MSVFGIARSAMGVVGALAVAGVLLVGCSSHTEEADRTAAYCIVVARTVDAMAGDDPAVKRPAMAARRDVAPVEIRAYWDTVFAVEAGDPSEREVARRRIEDFEAAHC